MTVDDVLHVVDTGLVKEIRYDPNLCLSKLTEVFVSRSSARQRAGRAGRVRPGYCWRLYSSAFLYDSKLVADFPLPEICRVPLEEVVLRILLLRLGQPESFLARCVMCPSLQQIRSAIRSLLNLRAVLPVSGLPLTPLGLQLARLPMDVRLAKMLVVSVTLGCEEPVLTIAAALCGKSVFVTPHDAILQNAAESARQQFMIHSLKLGETASTMTDTMHILSDHLAIGLVLFSL